MGVNGLVNRVDDIENLLVLLLDSAVNSKIAPELPSLEGTRE